MKLKKFGDFLMGMKFIPSFPEGQPVSEATFWQKDVEESRKDHVDRKLHDSHDIFCLIMSFKNFPFIDLESHLQILICFFSFRRSSSRRKSSVRKRPALCNWMKSL